MPEPIITTQVHPLHLRTLAGRLTLAQGQCCDMKLESADGDRWWVCRMDPGHTDHRITIERYNPADGSYTTTHIFTDPPE